MLKKVTHIIVLLLAIIFTTTSCQKFNEKTYEDYNFIQLKYDMDVDFSKYQTFAIVDTINIISDTIYNGEGGYPDFNIDMDGNTDGEYSKQIIENIIVYPLQKVFDKYIESSIGQKWLKGIFEVYR